MKTECTQTTFDFQSLVRRRVTARFDGGKITSDAGALLLRELEAKTGIVRRFAECFQDFRDPELSEFSVLELLKQRIFALCLGYEDLNDHDQLRSDALLAVAVGRRDPTGQDRRHKRDRGQALAGKSTLNRLELTPPGASADSRYKKIVARHGSVENFFISVAMSQEPQPPEQMILDLDATDDPLHGNQLGGFFHGYYQGYCYLPLYIFWDQRLLCAKLRPADIDAAQGSLKQVQRIVAKLRERWPDVRIILRADSGFCREHLMARCDTIRLKLLKIGAQVRVTVRRVWVSLAESYPYQAIFAQVFANLRGWLPPTGAG